MPSRFKYIARIAVMHLVAVLWIPASSFADRALDVSLFEKELVGGFERGSAVRSRSIDSAYVVRLATTDGFQRLDDPPLLQMMHLRADLARRADVATCADLWNGERYDAVVRAIEASTADKQRQWAVIFDDAAIATFNQKPMRQPPGANEVHLAMRRLLVAMPPPDQLAMLDLTADDARPTAAEQCRGVKLFYGRMEKMDPSDALIIMRSSLYH